MWTVVYFKLYIKQLLRNNAAAILDFQKYSWYSSLTWSSYHIYL